MSSIGLPVTLQVCRTEWDANKLHLTWYLTASPLTGREGREWYTQEQVHYTPLSIPINTVLQWILRSLVAHSQHPVLEALVTGGNDQQVRLEISAQYPNPNAEPEQRLRELTRLICQLATRRLPPKSAAENELLSHMNRVLNVWLAELHAVEQHGGRPWESDGA